MAWRRYLLLNGYNGRRVSRCGRMPPTRHGIKFYCPCGGFHCRDNWSKYNVDGFYFCPDTIRFFPNEVVRKENEKQQKIMELKWAAKEAARKEKFYKLKHSIPEFIYIPKA